MTEITELTGFVMEELYDINKHFRDLSSGIDLGKYDKEIATLREDCASKNYIIKILVENLSKHTDNKLIKKKQFSKGSTIVSPKKSIKINNTNKIVLLMLQETNFVSRSRFSILNCHEVMSWIMKLIYSMC